MTPHTALQGKARSAVSDGGSVRSLAGARPARLAPVSAPYLAYDIRHSYLASEARKEELALLYMEVFNSIPTVPDHWDLPGARNMVRARLEKPGCNIALVDGHTGQIAGAFFSNIIPGSDGWNLAHPDVFLAKAYRGKKLGDQLGFLGRQYANQLNTQLHGERLVGNESKTYKQQGFPRDMWKSKGYVLQSQFVTGSREIFGRNSELLNRLDIPDIHEADLPTIADFIADHHTVISSDGRQWSHDRAQEYVRFMFDNHYDTFVMAKMNDSLVAVSSADIMPGRTGPSMVESRMFVRDFSPPAEDTHARSLGRDAAAVTFYQLFIAANGVSKRLWRSGITTIEIPAHSVSFFRKFLPGLVEDQHFMSMEGRNDVLMENLKRHSRSPRIPIIGVDQPR